MVKKELELRAEGATGDLGGSGHALGAHGSRRAHGGATRCLRASPHARGGRGSGLTFLPAVKSASHFHSSFFPEIVTFSMTQGRKCSFMLGPGSVFRMLIFLFCVSLA